jgi:hypothetical protein
MKIVKIASALAVAGLVAGGGAAYLAKSGTASAARGASAAAAGLGGHSAAPGQLIKQVKPVTLVAPVKPVKPATPATPPITAPVTAPVTGAGPPITAPVAARPAAPSAAEQFNVWLDGTGRALLDHDFAVLSQARSDAAARNMAALDADAGSLSAAGNASLADPPPAFTASWNAAFAAMVQAGEDIQSRNLAGAVAESGTVQAEIDAFSSQASQ